MFSLWTRFWLFFSPYIHPVERKTDRFMNGLVRDASKDRVRRTLTRLIESDLIAVQLWFERVFRGYSYLKKSARREAYRNAEILRDLFDPESFELQDNARSRRNYLQAITTFFKQPGFYRYRKNLDFASLLKDPRLEVPQGDCNQMVTLYAWLYAQRFPITDLQIKVFPGHVCLHFNGEDLEVTTGKFRRYRRKDARILPIVELVAVNLLDKAAVNREVLKVDPKIVFQVFLLHALLGTYPMIADHNLKAGARSYLNQMVRRYQKMRPQEKKTFNIELYRELRKIAEIS